MAIFKYDENGNKVHIAKYSQSGVDTLVDIFPKTEKIAKMLRLKSKKWFRRAYNRKYRAQVVRKIFYDFLMLVFNELADGGMLEFPGSTGANIALKPLPDESVKRLSKASKLHSINIVKARFKVPVLKYDFGLNSPRKDRPIAVPARVREKMYKNAEDHSIKYTYYRKVIKR